MNVFLTGGSGFIGGNLAKKLASKNYKVKALVRKSSKVDKLKELGAELYYGDLSDTEALNNATKDADVVYHCAALVSDWAKSEEFYRVNVEGTRNLLDACINNEVKRLVYISSTDAVWKYDHHIKVDESIPYPKKHLHDYCKSKAESEKLCLKYYQDGKIEIVILRPCWVWGPGDYVVLPKIIKLAKNDELFLIGKGNNFTSICYIENLTDAILLASNKQQANGNIYFIDDGIDITISDFLNSVLDTLEIKWSKKKSIPYLAAYGYSWLQEIWSRLITGATPELTRYVVSVMSSNLNYSIQKAKNELNYEPGINLNQGLQNLKIWFDEVGGINKLID